MTASTQANLQAAQRIAAELDLVSAHVPMQRRVVHAGDAIHQAGERFEHLHIVNAGLFKLVNASADGREQVVALQFRGDWLGLEGIASGRYGGDAVAMDTGEVWSIRYDDLIVAAARQPSLVALLHRAMSREIARDRESKLSLCTLPADARVAEFLRNFADALAQRGLRTDRITLRMSRAEIGNYLGMKLETVSRALSRLAQGDVIRFHQKGRRDIEIPRVEALSAFVQRSAASPLAVH